ncbi:branched-chain amino acid aminotransferase [Luteitalea sp.]|jgi:branched-chain amino acid aminotransferase|uniref:branched-chain amino acid aminotransferase n=1 Tax=Luteitalea sp. TaxID=2004800 RepID=UPI0037CACDB4
MSVSASAPVIPVTRTSSPRPRPAEDALGFGKHFADHMLVVDYVEGQGWLDARIVPYGALALDPAASVLHYGQAMFEGLKAYRQADGRIALFRPDRNAHRMATGAGRLSIPAIDEQLFVQGIAQLVNVDADWVPSAPGTALYIRPTIIATEPFLGVRASKTYTFFVITGPVGAYYAGGLKPVRIWVEKERVRAVKGGIGAAKAAANYVASLQVAEEARARGCDQVLWLDAIGHEYVEEVGTMNLCLVIDGTLVTPPLGGSILPGITRETVLTMARDFGLPVEERLVSITEVREAHASGRLQEVFGVGTAAVVSVVGTLASDEGDMVINGGNPGPIANRLYDAITRIQYGLDPDPRGWRVII